MVEGYLLMIYVTVEQEEAIRQLFKLREWKYKRKGELTGDYQDETYTLHHHHTGTEKEKLKNSTNSGTIHGKNVLHSLKQTSSTVVKQNVQLPQSATENEITEILQATKVDLPFNTSNENASFKQSKSHDRSETPSHEHDDVAATNESTNVPVNNERNNVPATNERNNVPATNERNNVPATNERNNVPVTNERNNVPATNESNNVPATNERNNVPVNNYIYNVPVNNESNDVPAINERNDVPVTNERNNVPVTNYIYNVPVNNESNDVPAINERNDVPVTNERNNVPATNERNNVPATSERNNVPATKEIYNVPSTNERNNVPVTKEIYNVPATNERNNVPATNDIYNVPVNNESNNADVTIVIELANNKTDYTCVVENSKSRDIKPANIKAGKYMKHHNTGVAPEKLRNDSLKPMTRQKQLKKGSGSSGKNGTKGNKTKLIHKKHSARRINKKDFSAIEKDDTHDETMPDSKKLALPHENRNKIGKKEKDSVICKGDRQINDKEILTQAEIVPVKEHTNLNYMSLKRKHERVQKKNLTEKKSDKLNVNKKMNYNKRGIKNSNSNIADVESCLLMESNLPHAAKLKVSEIFKTVTEDKIGSKVFKCFHCSRAFVKKLHFLKHVEKHSKQEFDCPECGKKFKNHRNMNAHRFNRSRRKTFSCDICKYETTTFCLLRIHAKEAHPNSDMFHCHLCPKVVRTKSYLTIHLKHSHGIDEGKYECHICGKKSKRPTLFQKHLQEHEEDKNTQINKRQCQICKKIFKSKVLLNSHKRIHQERKHKCKQCSKSFTTITKLTGHERTHSGIKPFQCNLCDYKSTHSGNLRSHMKVHQREGEIKTEAVKTEAAKTRNKTSQKSTMAVSTQETMYSTSNPPQNWYTDKNAYPQVQSVTLDSTQGYTGQNMVYADQAGQVYGGELNYNGSKDVAGKLESHRALANEMYAEPSNNQYSMVYNNMQNYTNSYDTSQYYNPMGSAYIVQNESTTVTNVGKQDIINDGNLKQYAVPNTVQPQNIHHLYQEQPIQSLEHQYQQQQQYHPHQQQQQHPHHQQQQHQSTCQATTSANHMYHPSMTSESTKHVPIKQGTSLFTAQCYSDPVIDKHENQTNYNIDPSNPDAAPNKLCSGPQKSDFSNPNNRIYLGTQTIEDSLNYAYPGAPSLAYTENPSQQGYETSPQVSYTELPQSHFTNVSQTKMSSHTS